MSKMNLKQSALDEITAAAKNLVETAKLAAIPSTNSASAPS